MSVLALRGLLAGLAGEEAKDIADLAALPER